MILVVNFKLFIQVHEIESTPESTKSVTNLHVTVPIGKYILVIYMYILSHGHVLWYMLCVCVCVCLSVCMSAILNTSDLPIKLPIATKFGE